jgi:VanZ family protein
MKKIRVISWTAVIVCMSLIFLFSAQPAAESNSLSEGLVKAIVHTIHIIYPIDLEVSATQVNLDRLNGIVRECAHGVAYLILAMLVFNAFIKSGIISSKTFLLTIIFCAFYAATDEIHQFFVPGRACELFDFAVDSTGALTGSLLFYILNQRKNYFIFLHSK